MNLSHDCFLIYVLRESGCAGRLAEGRIERLASALCVYDTADELIEYVSGERLRSWCVFNLDRKPIDGWCQTRPEDASAMQRVMA